MGWWHDNFPETRSAWARLQKAMWKGQSMVHETKAQESTMTPEQKAHFDAAFEHMDRAFEEMRKAFK